MRFYSKSPEQHHPSWLTLLSVMSYPNCATPLPMSSINMPLIPNRSAIATTTPGHIYSLWSVTTVRCCLKALPSCWRHKEVLASFKELTCPHKLTTKGIHSSSSRWAAVLIPMTTMTPGLGSMLHWWLFMIPFKCHQSWLKTVSCPTFHAKMVKVQLHVHLWGCHMTKPNYTGPHPITVYCPLLIAPSQGVTCFIRYNIHTNHFYLRLYAFMSSS